MFSPSREIEYITCVSHLIPFFVLISVVSKSIFFKNVDYVEVDKKFFFVKLYAKMLAGSPPKKLFFGEKVRPILVG